MGLLGRERRPGELSGSSARRRVHAKLFGVFGGVVSAGLLLPFLVAEPVKSSGIAASAPSGGETPIGEPLTGETADRPGTTTVPAAGSAVPGASEAAITDGGPPARTGEPPAGGGTAGTPDTASGGSPQLTASDTGVSESTVRVGIPVIDLGNLSRIGDFGPTNPEQQRRSWQAFIDEINEAGGIHGRQLEPFYRSYDALSADDQRAACLYFAEDAKVFAVVGGFNLEGPHYCLTEEHGIPTITLGNVGISDDAFRRSRGRLSSLTQRGSRLMNNFADQLHRGGRLRGKQIGLTGDEASDAGGKTGKQLVEALERLGYSIVHRTQYSADYGTASSQVPVEVQQMRSKGVDAILMISHSIANQQFVQAAEGQGYNPSYFTTDWGAQTLDATTSAMPESFEGAIGVTSSRFNDTRANLAEGQRRAGCAEVYERRTGTRLAREDEENREATEYGGVMTSCVMTAIFHQAATGSGANLTRDGYSQALQAAGPMPILEARVGPGSFGPEKLDAPDTMRLMRWRFACKCWEPISEFRRTTH